MSSKAFHEKGFIAAFLCCMLLPLSMVPLGSVLPDILKSFPGLTLQVAQLLVSTPGLFVMLAGFISPLLARVLPKRVIIIMGLSIILITTPLGLLFHDNIVLLFIWRAMLGFGVGMFNPIIMAAVSDNFTGSKRASLIGTSASAQNVGAIIMTVVGGIIAAFGWYNMFFIHLLTVPAILLSSLFVSNAKPVRAASDDPKTKKSSGGLRAAGLDGITLIFSLIQFILLFMHNATATNLSVLMAENGITDTAVVGIVSSVVLVGGIVSGILFAIFNRFLKKFTIPLGFMLYCISFFGLALSKTLPMFIVFAFVGGVSFAFIAAQVLNSVVENKKPHQFAFANACVSIFGSVGAFTCSFLTPVIAAIFNSEEAKYRMFFFGG
ncbi:MAG: MFS transporter, partial [Synergistes sp.]|nr:MFS transporter [Synergistes sp.]